MLTDFSLFTFHSTMTLTPISSPTDNIPVIVAYGRAASIRFNEKAVKLLGIKPGQQILMSEDKDSEQLYITAADTIVGGRTLCYRSGKHTSVSLQASYKQAATRLCQLAQCKSYCSFAIAQKPVTINGQRHYRIVTSKAITTN